MSTRFLTTTEAAAIMQVSAATIRNWTAQGHLLSHTTVGGHRRYALGDIETLAREQAIPVTLPQSERASQGLKILLVDNDRYFLAYVSDLLEEVPNIESFDTAVDGFEAGLKIRDLRPDVLLLDWNMPGMGGLEVCQRIKADPYTKDMIVIITSGFLTAEVEAAAREAGVMEFLKKPIDIHQPRGWLGLELPAIAPVS